MEREPLQKATLEAATAEKARAEAAAAKRENEAAEMCALSCLGMQPGLSHPPEDDTRTVQGARAPSAPGQGDSPQGRSGVRRREGGLRAVQRGMIA